eukprot:1435122-Alexandrium_andersonii.AAC.1
MQGLGQQTRHSRKSNRQTRTTSGAAIGRSHNCTTHERMHVQARRCLCRLAMREGGTRISVEEV